MDALARAFDVLRRQRRAVLAGLAVLVALGVGLGLRLPAAILPEVTFPRITVIAESGERPAEEMVRAVTRPLETSLQRVPNVHEIRSTTSRGSTEINLDCRWNVDMERTLQLVQAQTEAVRGTLPDGTTLEARLMNAAIFPVFGLSLVSDRRSLAELRDLAVTRLQPELSRVAGVAEVVVQGGAELEARVTLDPAMLESRGLDAHTVADHIRNASELRSVGLLERNRELYLSLSNARPVTLPALGAIPVPVDSGPPVRLDQLGTITLQPAPQFTRHAAQSRDAVLVNLRRQPTASTVQVADGVRKWFASHPAALPADVHMQTFYDQSDLVRASIASVRDSLLIGALMAIVIVALFLRSLRLGLAGAIVLPGSIGLTLLTMVVTHQSLNLMTLGGIAAAVGLVLDDAIVVVEHLAHRGAEDASVPRSVAMAEIAPSLLGSSLCTIAIFIPFVLLDGVTGAFFKVLALSMTVMLASSLLLCVTIVPWFAGGTPKQREGGSRAGRLLERASAGVARRPWLAWLIPALLIAAIVPLRASVGSGFLPEMDEGSLILDYIAPPGTSLEETDRMLRHVDAEIDSVAEVAAWSRRTGDQLGFFITEPNSGDYVLRLKDKRDRAADEVADGLRQRIEGSLPALQIEFGQLIEDVVGDLTTTPQPIEVRVLGEDRPATEARARDVAAILEGTPGVVDVNSGVVVSGPDLEIAPGPGAELAGLGSDALAQAVEPYIQGVDAGVIPRGARAWPVRVVLPAPAGVGARAALAEARVPIAHGRWVRLGDVATVRVRAGETEIARDNLRTVVSATARLSGRDMGSAMRDVQTRIAHRVALAPGMTIQYAGLWAEQQAAFRGLAGVLLGAAAAVLLILLVAFRSWARAGAVLAVVGASLAGAFAALKLGGATFNITSFVGAIMVVGIVGENAYFLVAEHVRGLRAGQPPLDAALHAARRRTRPVLMTTAAGVAALAPLALGVGSGSALLKPLAIAVVGGFLNAAPLLLIVLPGLLAHTGRSVD